MVLRRKGVRQMYEIEKCVYTNCWIVFKRLSRNAWKDVKHGKTKKECKEWLFKVLKK